VIPVSLDLADPGAYPGSGPLRPPAIVAPAPRQVSFGRVSGHVSRGTAYVLVKVNGVVRARGAPAAGRFRFDVALPPRDCRVQVVAVGALGDRRSRTVSQVFGLPRRARPTGPRRTSEDAALARTVRALVRGYPGIGAAYVEDLRSRRGAAWNARARFPAASTVKVAIALEVLRTLRGPPAAGSSLDRLLRSMLVYSDNAAANALLTWIGGSTSGGASRVNETLHALGIWETYMYGGYVLGTAAARPIPLRVDEQPAIGIGKYTTAHDLARLHRAVYLAAGGRGPATGLPGAFTSADARFLMWILAHVADPGKLDRYLPDGVPVLHKAGWILQARHDAGIVFWEGGAYVAVVMTWHGAGVGPSSDVLAGRVAAASLKRYRQLSRVARASTADDSSSTA
jgi:beta-lactamase class A